MLRHPPYGSAAVLSMTLLWVLALLGACSEVHLTPKPTEDTGRLHTSTSPPLLPEPTTPQPPVDPCDGLDNDGDGLIDEGAPDADADGIGDCVDDQCEAAERHAEVVGGAPSNSPGIRGDTVERTTLLWARPEGDPYMCAHVVVGPFDARPGAEVLCSTYDEGVWVLDGATGEHLQTMRAFRGRGYIELADVDADGRMEVIGLDAAGHLVAQHLDQSVVWQTTEELESWNNEMVSPIRVIDIDCDGQPEVATPTGLVSGADGTLLELLDNGDLVPAVGFRDLSFDDLDADGAGEFVTQFWAVDTSGVALWSVTPSDDWWGFVTHAILQADADVEGEVAFVTSVELLLIDADGAELQRIRTHETRFHAPDPFPACVGDLDGDGQAELVVPSRSTLTVYNMDGSIAWARAVADWSAGSQCSTFDFDLDGRDEVLVTDERRFSILDGRSGATLFMDGSFESGTWLDAPWVVDLDGDGSVEILVSGMPGSRNGGPTSPLRAYTHPDGAWPPGSSWWPTETWTGLELNDDGSVPRTPGRPWVTYGHWRSQPEGGISGYDLSAELTDACASRCEGGVVHLAARIVNRGPQEADAGLPLALYTCDEHGTCTLREVQTLPDWLDDGTASPTLDFALSTEDARLGLRLVAGDDGSALDPMERYPDDNSLDWAWEGCP